LLIFNISENVILKNALTGIPIYSLIFAFFDEKMAKTQTKFFGDLDNGGIILIYTVYRIIGVYILDYTLELFFLIL